MSPNFWLAVEKIVMTYVQSFLGLLILDLQDTLSVTTPTKLAIAALPAAITVISATIPQVSNALPYYTQVILNAARTFVQGFLGFLLAQQVFVLDVSIGKAAWFAALPAALSVLKSGIARGVGSRQTANLLPIEQDPQVRGTFAAAA